MKPIKPLFLLSTFCFLLFSTACVPRMIMNHMDRDSYLKYRTNAEQTNLEREKAGLQPNPIMTLEEFQHTR